MTSRATFGIALVILAATACASLSSSPGRPAGPDQPDAAASLDGSSNAASSADGSAPPDPFAPQADAGDGLTDVSADLNAVLENGALAGACDAWQATPSDRHAMLLCGKSMFFDESFGTAGVPAAFATFLVQNFPALIGTGFSKLGLIPDPRSTQGLPLGMAPGAPLNGTDTLSFTCASCHFAQLQDGRYAVGAPNLAYQYGVHNLDLAVFPLVAATGTTQGHDPAALAVVQPLVDAVNASSSLKAELLVTLASVAGAASAAPIFSAQAEHLYASWLSGTMDFFIEPLPYDDHIHTISKMSALWGIPTDAEVASSGMAGAMLGWTGSTRSLLHFFEGFVSLGGGSIANWPDAQLAPIQAYVESLRAPVSSAAFAPGDVARGQALFTTSGCIECHGGPRGSGLSVYTYAEIGTDSQMARWTDPNDTGVPCCGITFEPGDALTHGIKSPRLVGLWTMNRFLHNGSVASLESLLCTPGPRGDAATPPYGDEGHMFGCDLASDDKEALLAFLKTR
jgi:hypothetical protein